MRPSRHDLASWPLEFCVMGVADINVWRRQNSDTVSVLVTLSDGTRLRGNILQPRDKNLREFLCMPDPFMEFECAESGAIVIAKTAIASVRVNAVPDADQLDKKVRPLDKADPHRILGLGNTATREDIRAAYLALARAYHPDRFASSELPSEMAEYIDAMSRRINLAYAALVPPVKAQPVVG
jgi:DnaJ domain